MSSGLFALVHRRTIEEFAGIPGPRPSFPLGTALDFVRGGQPWEVCARYADQYGPVTLIWLMGRPALVLQDPELIGEVLDSQWQNFYKNAPCKALEPVITTGSLFISNYGHGWSEGRRENPLSMDAFDGWLANQVAPLSQVLTAGVRRLISRSPAQSVDLYWETQRLTFDAFAQAFWGRTFDESQFQRFQTLARTGDRRMKSPLPLLPPLNPWFLAARREWYEGFVQLVREARKNPRLEAVDLLQVTLRRGTPLTDAQLAEALATNFFGGVFSGSSTINTALYLLSRHPEEMRLLESALEQDLGAEGSIDGTALQSCRQLDYVVREAMRYYPAVPIYFRNSSKTETVRLGQHVLPPDTQIFISNWWLHKSSPHWSEPDKFLPARWANGVAEQNPVGSGYFFPFGRGPRACIGQPFALFYIKLALATILRESHVEIDPQQPYQQSFFFGVMMPKGLMARVEAVA
jgi:cytochrome P450